MSAERSGPRLSAKWSSGLAALFVAKQNGFSEVPKAVVS